MTAELGTGIDVDFGTSTGFVPRVLGINFSGISRPVIDDHDMASTHADKWPGQNPDYGSVDVEYAHEQDDGPAHANGPPVEAAPETITFQWPIKSGQSTGASLAGLGFVNNLSFSAPYEDRGVGSFSVTWATKPTFTAGA